jgi:signal transduction histidine kinase
LTVHEGEPDVRCELPGAFAELKLPASGPYVPGATAADAAEAMRSSADTANAAITHMRFMVFDSFRRSGCASLEAPVLEECSAPPKASGQRGVEPLRARAGDLCSLAQYAFRAIVGRGAEARQASMCGDISALRVLEGHAAPGVEISPRAMIVRSCHREVSASGSSSPRTADHSRGGPNAGAAGIAASYLSFPAFCEFLGGRDARKLRVFASTRGLALASHRLTDPNPLHLPLCGPIGIVRPGLQAGSDPSRHGARAVVVTAVLGVAATLLVSFSSEVRFAYSAPSLHLVLETAAGLIALLAAYLVLGRFRESGRLDDLVLAAGLGLLSASNLLFSTFPSASEVTMGRFPTWAPLIGRLLGAFFVACAAFLPATRLRNPRRSALVLFGFAALLLAAIGVFVALLADHLPAGVDPMLSPPQALSRPQLSGHPVVLAVQLQLAVLYAIAAVGFTRRAQRTDDELLHWFSIGSVLAAIAALHYFLFPSLYSQWVYTGDLIRLLANLVLLAGAAREIGRYWRGLAAIAVLEERRRIAWDLHDGVAQELAFILRRARRAEDSDSAGRPIAAAAERALADARRAIAALTKPLDESLDIALAQAVEDVADRFGQELVLDLQPDVRVDPMTREQLIRIAREAVLNAARHGRAPIVRVELSNGARTRMRVADNGRGFDPDATDANERFGLVGMRERARVLDAQFRLMSVPGEGTEIEVVLQ